MKGILLDENIPRRTTFTSALPISHATDLGKSVSDSSIWRFARLEGFVVVTKDADFSNRIMLSAPPPWIVHLRFGNLRRADFHALLARVWPQVEALLPAHKLINVYEHRIEAIRS